MKQDVNYILHHKNVNIKMMEDDLSPIHLSLYNALFLLWNRCDYDTQLSINRNDVMKLSKIGSANTYTSALKTLDAKGYINYQPSFNPMKGSLVTIIRFDKGSGKGTDKGTGKSTDIGSDNASGKATDTLYKHIKHSNILTVEHINTIVNFYDLMSEEEIALNIDFFEKYIQAVKDGEIEISEQDVQDKNETIKFLIDDFGFSEMRFAPQQRIVLQFVTNLIFRNELKNFNEQYSAYKKFKAESGEKSHSFRSLIGTVQNQFTDGAWNSENWNHRLTLEREKEKSSGKKEKGKAEAILDLHTASTDYWDKVEQLEKQNKQS